MLFVVPPSAGGAGGCAVPPKLNLCLRAYALDWPHLALRNGLRLCRQSSGNELPKGGRDSNSCPRSRTVSTELIKDFLHRHVKHIPGQIPVLLQRPRVLPNRQLQGADLGHHGVGKVRGSGGPDVPDREPVLEAAQVRRRKSAGRGGGPLLRLAAERHRGQHPRELPRDVRHGARGGQEQDRVLGLAQVGVLKFEKD